MLNLSEFYKDFDNPLNLNEENIRRCNNQSQFSAGTSIANSAHSKYILFFTSFPEQPNYTEEQKSYLLKRANLWRELIEKAYNEELSRRAVFVPVNVAGPAKYNFEKANKQADMIMKKASEWEEKAKSFISNTYEGINRLTPISVVLDEIRQGKRGDLVVTADDEHAMPKLEARLSYLLETQTMMKNANKHYRKFGTMKGFYDNDENAEKMDIEISKHFSWEKQPFPSYELTSINSKIKRVKERIAHISNLLTNQPFKDFDFEGGKVVANYTEDRLQVIFDSKPDEEIRANMKNNGFRWAPSQGAWQRQLTKNAYNSARLIFEIKDDENEQHRKEDS